LKWSRGSCLPEAIEGWEYKHTYWLTTISRYFYFFPLIAVVMYFYTVCLNNMGQFLNENLEGYNAGLEVKNVWLEDIRLWYFPFGFGIKYGKRFIGYPGPIHDTYAD
jgi:hypothetical protein